jgi:hypothetical protein
MYTISELNHNLVRVIHKCLKVNPKDRAALWEIRALLQHIHILASATSSTFK